MDALVIALSDQRLSLSLSLSLFSLYFAFVSLLFVLFFGGGIGVVYVRMCACVRSLPGGEGC